ncbi:MAG: penicillin-binding protein 2 [Rickettsiales bacterium]|nr:penicillin-binding protein 2 [Rickettsiales bacterium]
MLIFLSFIAVGYIILLVTLYNMSVKNNSSYKHLSLLNKLDTVYEPAPRGNILDRNNILLTNNKLNYLLYIKRGFELDIQDAEHTIVRDNILIKRNNWDKIIALIEKNTIENITIENNYIREYLYPYEFGHIIGFTTKPNDAEIKKIKLPKPLLLHSDYKIGKSGIEKMYNNHLSGSHGMKYIDLNKKLIDNINYINGKDLKLTIDINLQKFIANKTMDVGRSAIIVMNIVTGEILGMISNPTFNNNLLNDGKYYKSLLDDIDKPMIDRTISATYPPGSTFKPIVAIAALKKGWNPNKYVVCNGSKNIGKKRVLYCWNKKGHGKINLVEAIKHSCNIYFSEVGIFAGIDAIYNTAVDFGFGETFDLELPGIKNGIIPNREWKIKRYNEVWTFGDTVNISIGQGFLTATPLELLVMTARIANGGYPIKPTLVNNSQTIENNKKLFINKTKIVDDEILDIVKEGMYKVVNEIGGTVYYSRIRKNKWEMSGKTGTSQVVSKNTMDLLSKNKTNIANFENHALFVGFAPSNNPKYAIVVVVEHGKSGSGGAAPIARDVFEFMYENDI